MLFLVIIGHRIMQGLGRDSPSEAMIAALSPAGSDHDETTSTLQSLGFDTPNGRPGRPARGGSIASNDFTLKVGVFQVFFTCAN